MATVGALTVDITANVARLQKDVNAMRKSMNGFKKSATDANNRLASFEKGIRKITGVVGSVMALSKAWDLAFNAAKFQQNQAAFANLAASHGVNANNMIENLKAVSGQTLSTAQVMETAGKALLLGIPADKFEDMMKIARAASRITGDSIQKSFEDIATGMGRQSKLILDNLGIIVDVRKASEDYAATIGKTASQLTDAEKKTAFFNATMKAGEDIVKRVNVQQLTAAEAMQKFKAQAADLAIILGKVIFSVTAFGTALVMAIGTGINMMIASLTELVAKIVDLGRHIPGLKDKAEALSKTIRDWNKVNIDAVKIGDKAVKNSIEMGKAIFRQDEATIGLVRSTEDLIKAEDDLAKKRESAEKKIQDTILATARLTANTEELLAIEAWEFKQTGASIDQIDRLVSARQRQLDVEADIKKQKDAEKALIKAEKDVQKIGGQLFGEKTELGMIEEENARKLELLQEFYDARKMIIEAATTSEMERAEEMARLENDIEQKKKEFAIQAAAEKFGVAANFFQNLFVLTGQKNKKLFDLMKGFSMAEALINTYNGATVELAKGGVAGIAKAAVVIASGLARVASIRATQPGSSGGGGGGGGGISAGGAATPNFRGGSFDSQPVPQRLQGTQNIEIHIVNPLVDQNWEKIVQDNVVPQLQGTQNLNITVLEETT